MSDDNDKPFDGFGRDDEGRFVLRIHYVSFGMGVVVGALVVALLK